MITYLLAAIFDVLVGLLVWRSRRDLPGITFLLVTIAIAAWSLELFALSSIKDLATLHPIFHGLRPGLFFIGPLMLLLVILLTRLEITLSIFLLFTVPLAISALMSVFNIVFFPSTLWWDGTLYAPVIDPIAIINQINFTFCLIGAAGIAFWKARSGSSEHARLGWLVFISLTAATTGMFSFVSAKYVAGTAANFICVGAYGYILLRSKPVSPVIALNNGTVRLVVVLILSLLFFATNAVTALLTELDTAATLFMHTLVLAGILEAYPHLNRWLLRKRDRLYHGDTHTLEYIKALVMKRMHGRLDAQDFERLCTEVFVNIMKTGGYQIHLKRAHFFPQIQTNTAEGEEIRLYDAANQQAHPATLSPLNPFSGSPHLADLQQPLLPQHCPPDMAAVFNDNGIAACVPLYAAGETVGFITLPAPWRPSPQDLDLLAWLGHKLCSALEHVTAVTALTHRLHEAEQALRDTPGNAAPLALSLIADIGAMLKRQQYRPDNSFDLNSVLSDRVTRHRSKGRQVSASFAPLPRLRGDEAAVAAMVDGVFKYAFAGTAKENASVILESWFEEQRGAVACRISHNGFTTGHRPLADLFENGIIDPSLPEDAAAALRTIKDISDANNIVIMTESVRGLRSRLTFHFPPSSIADTLKTVARDRK